MNWRDADGTADGVVVGDEYLSGYIWGENAGWINVGNGNGPYSNTTGLNFGVNILPNGDLEGYWWGENIGWVNFDTRASLSAYNQQTRFDSVAGRFRGYAWGENAGWINLDDTDHFVAVLSCPEHGFCNDRSACTYDRYVDPKCQYSPRRYGDIDHNGTISIFDLFCVLNGFGGDFSVCTFGDCDIEPCDGNCVINIFDLFAVLNAFGGEDACGCGTP